MPSGSSTAPPAVFSCATGTPLCWAAAAFSVSRATAPARRSLSKLSGTVLEPPVACMPTSFITAPAASRAVSAIQLWSVERKGTASLPSAVL